MPAQSNQADQEHPLADGVRSGSKPQHSEQDQGGDSDNHDISRFDNPLPGDATVWEKCALGKPETWPEALKAFAVTVSSFPYPTCVFWAEEFILLHNDEWTKAGGIDGQQGQKQRGELSADAFNGLSSALHGGAPKRVSSRALLRGDSMEKAEEYTVLLSPLFDGQCDKEGASGVLAQMLPRPLHQTKRSKHSAKEGSSFGNQGHANNNLKKSDGSPNQELDISQLGTVVDNVPLDEHPFFHRFAEMLPTGLAILDHRAQAVFVNQHFYQLTTHRGEDRSFKSWPQSIHEDDYERVMNAYHDAFTSQKQLRTEFRAIGEEHPWRLLLLTPLGDENLQHVSLREYGGFICSIVDITSEKSAEIEERKAAKEARERREQQERFIDMISHEIRNPLSAVLHCAEDIIDAVEDEAHVKIPMIKEAVDTINLCIQHQRNIVDDVLSFSKLDASMLSLTPKSSMPSRQLANSLKMFQPEFRKQSMKFGYRVDRSYTEHGIQWVMADLARINQVLVNLVSNAVKFTAKGNGEKQVVVSVGASADRPTSYPPNVVFFNSEDRAYRMDATNTKVSSAAGPPFLRRWGSDMQQAWGHGEPMYIMVAVKDTGIGISDEGQRKLFERFRQATPKTEEIYGGSGLGLNISRKLCHLHGGEIGVSSREGEGSTFGFFFKVRRTNQPEDYEGRPEEQEIDDATLRTEVKNLGNTSPDEIDPDFMPESLKDPPVEYTEEASPHPSGKGSAKFEKTARVAAQVEEKGGDQYSAAEGSKANAENEKPEPQDPTTDATSQGPTEKRRRHPDLAHRPREPLARENTRPHVLLVEDNVINQKIVHRKLEAKGFNVTTANNGKEAVEKVKKAPKPSSGQDGSFDAILMDQEMPIMDGNTASKAIRELESNGELEHIPILGVTANVRGAQQDEMIEAGMVSCVKCIESDVSCVKKANIFSRTT
jgi:signal transduction histidine kinase/CheY-like chemotaxis protein